jgi:plasmid stability protein
MIRKQVYIDEELEAELKALAGKSGRSEAEHIREALRRYLASRPGRKGPDPLLQLVGLVDFEDGPDDVAENHDRYLYDNP